ncbi:MAG: DNA replication and repair protein RecF [Saprospiraceae bacterium]|nr:DNA replication and repair protein RecF [Saprospiraceae bacterium]
MFLKHLQLIRFKNYESLEIDFAEGIHILTGNNGQGKTNLLDAIYLLCMTKSYFQYSEKNLILFGNDFFRVKGTFIKNNQPMVIDCKYRLHGTKSFVKDDKEVKKYASFIGTLPVVMITPADIQLIEEGSEERRRFLDMSICQVENTYTENLNKYNKLLRQRNSHLKTISNQSGKKDELLEFYDDEMARLSVMILFSRQKFTDEMSGQYKELYGILSSGMERVKMEYRPDCIGDVKEFKEMFTRNLQKDILLERTTHGIHRDDIEFYIEDMPVKRVGSQGQIKSTIFAAKLSQYQWLKKFTSTLPILLLDDIFDKLDHNRVTNLLKIIDSNIYGQIFITDTYKERIRSILPELNKSFKCFTIQQGQIDKYE